MRKIIETDVAIIAAGLSGLAASVASAEEGLKVVAVEKSNVSGGAANMGMGLFGAGTKYQRMAAYDVTPGEVFRRHMDFIHWNADARLVRDYYFKSADTIQWLEDMGVQFFTPGMGYPVPERARAYASSFPTGHIVKPEGAKFPGPRCAAAMTKALTNRARELGAEILYETKATKILMEDGRAVGILAQDKSGEEIEIRSKAVVVATGGFGDNPQMIKEYTGYEWGKDLFSFRIPGMQGDGIKMAWEVGAASTNITMELMYQCPDNLNVFSLDGAFRSPDLWVNKHGERFIEESQTINGTYTGNAIAHQPGHFAVSILDSSIAKYYQKHGPASVDHVHGFDLFEHFTEDVDAALANGYQYVYKADTLEELAEQAGIDQEGLVQTVEEYNEMCEDRWDSLFEKEPKFLRPLKKGPYYGLKFFIGAYGTLGGIKINYKTEVQDKNEESIPGLYAVGTDACNIYGDCYPFTLGGNTMGFCVNTGRIAAENIADYIDKHFS